MFGMAEDRSWIERLAFRLVDEDDAAQGVMDADMDDAHHRLVEWKRLLAKNPKLQTIAAQHQPQLAALHPSVLKRVALELIEFAYAFGCLFISQAMEQEYRFRSRLGRILTSLTPQAESAGTMQRVVERQRTGAVVGDEASMTRMRLAMLKRTPLSTLPLDTLPRREMAEALIEVWEAILQNTLMYVTSMYNFLKQTGEEAPWTKELVLVLRNIAMDDDDNGGSVENLLLWDLNALENIEDPEDDLHDPIMNPHSLPLRRNLSQSEVEHIIKEATDTLMLRISGLSPLAQYALGKPRAMQAAMEERARVRTGAGAGAGMGGGGGGAGSGAGAVASN